MLVIYYVSMPYFEYMKCPILQVYRIPAFCIFFPEIFSSFCKTKYWPKVCFLVKQGFLNHTFKNKALHKVVFF